MVSIKVRSARTVLAGAIVIGAALSLPAGAASGDPAPTLRGTSLVNGWSHLSNVVAASYDLALVRTQSSVTLKDKTGGGVEGVVALDAKDKRVLTFTTDDPMSEARAPYTVTFSAHGVDQDSSLPDTVDTKTFKVDAFAPKTPTIFKDPEPVPGAPTVLAPGDVIKIMGKATDTGLSGISKVELHFYNPAVTAPRGDEAVAFRMTQTFSCSGGLCADSVTYSFTVSTMPAGYWTVRTQSIDLAGNRSSESAAVSFLVTKQA